MSRVALIRRCVERDKRSVFRSMQEDVGVRVRESDEDIARALRDVCSGTSWHRFPVFGRY